MSRHPLPHIAARLYDQPLLILEDAAITIANVLADRLGMPFLDAPDGVELRGFNSRALAIAFEDDDTEAGPSRPLYETRDGIAFIPVRGELINRGSWLSSVSGLTSYEALGNALKAARDDPSVSGIALDVDSPGGEAANAIETGALVREVAKVKPVVAFVNSLSASAAYAITAGATRVFGLPSSSFGSIGVLRIHRDRTGALAKAGIKPTIIRSAEHKAEGSGLEPLSDDAHQRMRAQLGEMHDFFVSHVAAMRNISADAVNATKGEVLLGPKAVEAGLADELGTFDDAMNFLTRGRMHPPIFKGVEMSDAQNPAQIEAAAAKDAADKAAKDARAAERMRTQAILNAPEAKGREEMAKHLAFNDDMSAEAAIALLKVAPIATPSSDAGAASNRLEVPVPPVNPDASANGPDPKAALPWDKVAAQLNEEMSFTHPGFRAPTAR